MDEKTETLREIFLDVADDETVTEPQRAPQGSPAGDEDVRVPLRELVAEMRDRYDFGTRLTDDQLCELVRRYFDDATDAELARELGVDRGTVVRSRLDLQLIRDRDTDPPFDWDAFRTRVLEADDAAAAMLAAEFDVTESTARRYRNVVEAQDRARRANDRYRDEFAALLGGADLERVLSRGIREDGLDDATDGMETSPSF